MNILVVGGGLNSFVSASLFASVGNTVYFNSFGCSISRYQLEPGLESLFKEQVEVGRIVEISTTNQKLEESYEIIVLGEEVETYSLEDIDWTIKFTLDQAIWILLSPSDIGEAIYWKKRLNSRNNGNGSTVKNCIDVISCPLLIREGRALEDFSRPELITLGCDTECSAIRVKALMYPFNRQKDDIKIVSTKEAEFACFASHAMLATRLSFMNEMAALAEKTGVDIDVIRACIGSDPRIGSSYLYPGCGYGGATLSKNLQRISSKLKRRNDDLGLLDIVAEINNRQKDLLFRKIWHFFGGSLKGKVIAVWGVSFKPETDSIEGAPALQLIESLTAQQAEIVFYDPMAKQNAIEYFAEREISVKATDRAMDACDNADVLVVCTEWKELWNPSFAELAARLRCKAIFDGRNIYGPDQVKLAGLKYFGIGRQ